MERKYRMPKTKTRVEDPLAKIWEKIEGGPVEVGRAGCIPIYDGKWRVLRNTYTIYDGAENCADPVKVDKLRLNVVHLINAFPGTMVALEGLGLRVRRLVSHPIKTPADVTAWATSVFNVGPISLPQHIFDTQALVYDDFILKVPHTDTYVVPANPRGSGIAVLRDFTQLGLKQTYGPRHAYSKVVFADQNGRSSKAAQSPATAPDGVTEGPTTPRRRKPSSGIMGRPRKDGLTPGSAEAKEADRIRRKEARAAKRAAARATVAADVIETPAEPEPTPEAPVVKRRGRLQDVA